MRTRQPLGEPGRRPSGALTPRRRAQAAIKDDKALQAWAADLVEHGKVATMAARIESRAQLIALLTNVLYIFTALHCAVNYSQVRA